MITGCFLFCSEWFGFCLVYYLYCSYNACSCHPLSVTVSMGLHCYFFSEICVMSRRPKSSSVSSSACGSGTVPESRPLLLPKSQTVVRSCPALGHARILCPSRSSLGASQGAKTRALGARWCYEIWILSLHFSSHVEQVCLSSFISVVWSSVRTRSNSPRTVASGATLPGNFETWPCRKLSPSFKSSSGCYCSLHG